MTTLEILGAIVALLVAAGVFFFGFGMFLEHIRGIYDNWLWHEESRGLRKAGVHIVQSAHWFSEDPSAMNALKAAGEHYRDHGTEWRPDRTRDRWRALNRSDKAAA